MSPWAAVSADHPKRERESRKLAEGILRMPGGVKVLRRKNQQAPGRHVDRSDEIPPGAGRGTPIVEPRLRDPRVFANRTRVRFVEHERARFLEAEERGAAGAFLSPVQVDDASEGPAHVLCDVVVGNGEIGAFLAYLHEPVDVHARVRGPRFELVDLVDYLLRGGNHAVRRPDRKAQPAIVVVDEISAALLVLPVRGGRAPDQVPDFLRILQEIVDHDRRDRILYTLQINLEIRADI